jgi:hypothetical protein
MQLKSDSQSVTHVSEHLSPMSPVHTITKGRVTVANSRNNLTQTLGELGQDSWPTF